LQVGVRSGELTETKKLLRRWISARPNGDKIWQGILSDWQRCHDDAAAGLRAMMVPGAVGYAWMRHALRDIDDVGNNVEPERVVLTVMAVVWLHQDNPRRFKDHRALLFQISRRFRTLYEGNVQTWSSSSNGQPRRCYNTPSPRIAQVIGETLMKAVGVHAAAIHNRWVTEFLARQDARRATALAISNGAEPLASNPEDTPSN
jgi:hypothetical protein